MSRAMPQFEAPAPFQLPQQPQGAERAARSQAKQRREIDWTLIVDLVAIGLLAVLLVIAFLPPYGQGWIWLTVLGGTALGVGIGMVSQWRSWNAAYTVAAMIIGWFVFGPLLAMPDSSLWGFLPTGRTLRGLLTGPVTAWRDMLTVAPPLGTTYNLMTVPLLLAMVSGLLAISIARRAQRSAALAWVPQSAAVGVAFALGNVYSLGDWIFAIGWVAIVLFWTSYQRRNRGSLLVASANRNLGLRLLYQFLVLAVVSGIVLALAGSVEPKGKRHVLRESISQPLEVQDYASPLQAFRGNITNLRTKTLVTVSGADGKFLRLATLDAYDGISYNISNSVTGGQDGSYVRVGARIEPTDRAPRRDVAEQRIEVTIEGLPAGAWLPTVGTTKKVEFAGDRRRNLADSHYHNLRAEGSVVTAGLNGGDSYVLTATLTDRPPAREIRAARTAPLPQPEIGEVPDLLRDMANQIGSASSTAGDLALAVEAFFNNHGYFSHGVDPKDARSLPGHSYARLFDLLADQEKMVGDEEQYAVAMSLMMRARDVPARVVYGYQIPAGGKVKGDDVRAYTEVYLGEMGWVMFDPTPSRDRKLPQDPDPNRIQTRPHVENPPPPPERPDPPLPDDRLPVQPADPPRPPRRIDVQKVLKYTATYGLPLIVIVGPLVLILGMKHRRRLGRMRAEIVANRVAGGWSELLDVARDLGTSASPMATRTEQAAMLSAAFPKLEEHVDSNRLARQADVAVFAPDRVTEDQAAGYWKSIDEGVAALRGSVSKPRALAGRLSIRSFRGFQLADAGQWVSNTWANVRAQRPGRRKADG